MKLSGLVALMECDPIPWLQSDRPSTASTADAADLDVPSIAKEVAELLLSSLTRFPEKFKMPEFEKDEGSSDPYSHFRVYSGKVASYKLDEHLQVISKRA